MMKDKAKSKTQRSKERRAIKDWPNENGGKPEEPLLHAFNALCGGAKVTATPEECC